MNPHEVNPHQVLNLARLPFRHFGLRFTCHIFYTTDGPRCQIRDVSDRNSRCDRVRGLQTTRLKLKSARRRWF